MLPELDTIPSDLPSRVVYSLFRGAIRFASRAGIPLKRVTQLVRLAYYRELREQHPRSRAELAAKLGISLRTAAELGRLHKLGLEEPTEKVRFSRQVRSLIDDGPHTFDALLAELACEPKLLTAVLASLVDNGWIEETEGQWRVKTPIQSYIGGALPQKIDGLGRQQDVLAEAAWSSFFGEPDAVDTSRTWVFHADPEAFAAFRERSVHALRSELIELDEDAPSRPNSGRVGVTIVFSKMKE